MRKCKNGTYSVTISLNKKITTFSGYKTEKECFDLYLSNKEKELRNINLHWMKKFIWLWLNTHLKIPSVYPRIMITRG